MDVLLQLVFKGFCILKENHYLDVKICLFGFEWLYERGEKMDFDSQINLYPSGWDNHTIQLTQIPSILQIEFGRVGEKWGEKGNL